jgi:hypothetical protein
VAEKWIASTAIDFFCSSCQRKKMGGSHLDKIRLPIMTFNAEVLGQESPQKTQ